jgi:hypothetical protein
LKESFMSVPDAKDYALSRAAILNEAYKGLLAVHGGAIAAMLAFASQAALRSQVLLQAVFVSLFIFAVGLTLGLLIPYFRFLNSKAAEQRDRDGESLSRARTPSWWAYTLCQYLSVTAFLLGTLAVSLAGYTEAAGLHLAAVSACK